MRSSIGSILKTCTIKAMLLVWITHGYASKTQEHGDKFLNMNRKNLLREEGGKAANLRKLANIKQINIPDWFIIPSSMQQQFLESQSIFSFVQKLDSLCQKFEENQCYIQQILEDIQEKILQAPIPHEVKSLIANCVSHEGSYAVRSSGAIEDSSKASCAGLYTTELHCTSVDSICEAIQKVWASSFSMQVIQERHRLHISQTDCCMGVIIQKMIHSAVSGVASNIVLGTNYPGIEITANAGLGISTVDGEVSADHWVLHPVHGCILEQTLGEKEFYILPSHTEGVEKKALDPKLREQFVLREEQLSQLFQAVKVIADAYATAIDIEFAFDAKGKLWILQARPLVPAQAETTWIVDEQVHHAEKILARGRYSLPGVLCGRLVYVDSLEPLASGKIVLGKKDILLAHVTTNVWSQYLTHVGGIITKEGSPSSHSMLLAREKQIPCVIGIGEEFARLIKLDGTSITLDGHYKRVFADELPLTEIQISELQSQFEPVSLRPWASLEEMLPHLIHNKMVIWQDGAYWRKTPTYKVYGFQQELNMLRFSQVSRLLNRQTNGIEGKVIDDYTCNKLTATQEYISLFANYTLEDSLAFNVNHRNCIKEFLDICDAFTLNVATWRKYIDAYSRLRAYIWLGGGMRSYAERKVDEIGIAVQLPKYYLQLCEREIQQKTDELDVIMQQELYQLAQLLKDKNLPTTLADLYQRDQESYELVDKISQRYRFEHNIALDKPIDLSVVYERVLQAVLSERNGYHCATKNEAKADTFFLSGLPELKTWISISIQNRILQSDSHHVDARARLPVQKALLTLGDVLVGEGRLQNSWEVFLLSIDEISYFIEKYF